MGVVGLVYGSHLAHGPQIAVTLLGSLGLTMASLAGPYAYMSSRRRRQPFVRLDARGIEDRSDSTHFGLIAWNDIDGIRTDPSMPGHVLLDVRNPEQYLRQLRMIGARFRPGYLDALRARARHCGTPVTIRTHRLEADETMLAKEMARYLDAFGDSA